MSAIPVLILPNWDAQSAQKILSRLALSTAVATSPKSHFLNASVKERILEHFYIIDQASIRWVRTYYLIKGKEL